MTVQTHVALAVVDHQQHAEAVEPVRIDHLARCDRLDLGAFTGPDQGALPLELGGALGAIGDEDGALHRPAQIAAGTQAAIAAGICLGPLVGGGLLLRHPVLLLGDALLLGGQPLLFTDLALLGRDPLLLRNPLLFGGQALCLQAALALLLGLDLGEALPLGPLAAFLLFPLAPELFQLGLEGLLRLDQLAELLLVGLHRLLQLVAHLGAALLAGEQGLVMLLLFAEQGLEPVLGLLGGELVFRQLGAGGAQRLDGLDARLVEVVVVIERAAQFGWILLVEQQLEIVVVARLKGALGLLGQQLFLAPGLLLQFALVLLQFDQLALVLSQSPLGLVELGGGGGNGLLVLLQLGVEPGEFTLAELDGLLLRLDLGLHLTEVVGRRRRGRDKRKKQRACQQADATGLV